MRSSFLLKRNLVYFWRTNLAVVAGVAIAVGVLAGALMVGDSVRASLRDLFLQRLGNTSFIISAPTFFREQLADDIRNDEKFATSGFASSCPLIVLEGSITHESSNRRSTGIQVYGVDERFWKFHGRDVIALTDYDALISPSLAEELAASKEDGLLLKVSKQAAIPTESLHGRKDDATRTLRLQLKEILPASALGEFAIRPQQTSVRAIFVPLQLLQKQLEQSGKVNAILISSNAESVKTEVLEQILKNRISLADMGVRVRSIGEQHSLAVEADSALINDSLSNVVVREASELNMRGLPVLSYLANRIYSAKGSINYSLVTAIDLESFTGVRIDGVGAPIILNDWAAKMLSVKSGDELSMDYYVFYSDGGQITKTATFTVAGVIPINGAAADRELVPAYPGITDSENISDWDPPFPIDLKFVTKADEDYWHQYRTTPKAFIQLAKGQELWGTRFGKLTSIRIVPQDGSSVADALEGFRKKLKDKLNPAEMGFITFPSRAQGLEASRGATDFGEYFLYFSFFLVASALLLAGLFFKLGVEQRLREIGMLQAVGFPASRIRTLFLFEGLVLSAGGSLLGLAGALVYGKLMMRGLGTWWVGATGTTDLSLHVSVVSLIIGGAGGMIAALLSIVWALRGLSGSSARSLLHGEKTLEVGGRRGRRFFRLPIPLYVIFALAGLALTLVASFKVISQVAGFFGGGTLFLVALLLYQSRWLSKNRRGSISGRGWWSIVRMGFRNATHRPARSVLCIALIASAVFIVVAVDAFRRQDTDSANDKKSGSGGYALLAESDVPLVYQPDSPTGREALNLIPNQGTDELAGIKFERFRLRPGDDASCLNLYQPRNPRIIAATDGFIQLNRFVFQDSLATTEQEKTDPWLLLNRESNDDVVPVIADANSMTYVLHLELGDELVLDTGSEGKPIRLRLVAALADSLFQSELVMSERNFLRLFPEIEGYRFFLIDVPQGVRASVVTETLEERLSDFGFDVVSTKERLAEFHRVENTYLSTFQMLGGLGLALGTLGLAAILLRNVLERRRELALLRAVGYGPKHFAAMVLAENAFLLLSGLVIGTACALLAIAPVFLTRGEKYPIASLGMLILAVIASGLVASIAATAAVLRSPLLPALRAD